METPFFPAFYQMTRRLSITNRASFRFANVRTQAALRIPGRLQYRLQSTNSKVISRVAAAASCQLSIAVSSLILRSPVARQKHQGAQAAVVSSACSYTTTGFHDDAMEQQPNEHPTRPLGFLSDTCKPGQRFCRAKALRAVYTRGWIDMPY